MMIIKSPYEINETLGRLLKVLVEHDMTIFFYNRSFGWRCPGGSFDARY